MFSWTKYKKPYWTLWDEIKYRWQQLTKRRIMWIASKELTKVIREIQFDPKARAIYERGIYPFNGVPKSGAKPESLT